MIEIKKIKLTTNRGGNGGHTYRATIPSDWLKIMGIDALNRDLIMEFDGEKITIKGDKDMLNKKVLIKELVELHGAIAKEVDDKNIYKLVTHGDYNKILMGNRKTITYTMAIDNLINFLTRYKHNIDPSLFKKAYELKTKIESSEIKKLRFGGNPPKRFTADEKELYNYLFKIKIELMAGWED